MSVQAVEFAVLPSLLKGGDALIVVPPLARLDCPSLGPHVLQACADAAGYRTQILYMNVLLAASIGPSLYKTLFRMPHEWAIGDRLFAATAHGAPPLGYDEALPMAEELRAAGCDLEQLRSIERTLPQWVDRIADAIVDAGYAIVGCTTMFQQTTAGISLINAVKRRAPNVVTIMGGSNCEKEMAEGVASLSASIDVVFSGESEETFLALLSQTADSIPPAERTVFGKPCRDMDSIPTLNYSDYYEQLQTLLPEFYAHEASRLSLPYETSRGCWWGQKHHCTFCGLNDEVIAYRAKSPDRVLTDLKLLLESHPSKQVVMEDWIMPHEYFRDLLPRLAVELPGLTIFYEQKANISLEKAVVLKRAGVSVLQPGIEALATPLLRLMSKGTTAPQNISLLRYSRSLGISLLWNILSDLPGDDARDYESVLELVPLLWHLQPPSGVGNLSIDRFSPYFERPGAYGVRNIRPHEQYAAFLPPHVDASKIAYHFVADYQSVSREAPALLGKLRAAVTAWRNAWRPGPELPQFALHSLGDGNFRLVDSRRPELPRSEHALTLEEATRIMVKRPATDGLRQEMAAAIERGWVAELDNMFIPLATATAALLHEFQTGSQE